MKRGGCNRRRSETCSSLSKIDTKNNSITSGQFGGSHRSSQGIYRPGFKTISWRMGVVLKRRGRGDLNMAVYFPAEESFLQPLYSLSVSH